MHTFDILLQQIGLFIIYILAGVILVRTRVLSCETLEPISKFVLKMALPVMVFINITDGVERQVLYESWPIFVIAAIFYIFIYKSDPKNFLYGLENPIGMSYFIITNMLLLLFVVPPSNKIFKIFVIILSVLITLLLGQRSFLVGMIFLGAIYFFKLYSSLKIKFGVLCGVVIVVSAFALYYEGIDNYKLNYFSTFLSDPMYYLNKVQYVSFEAAHEQLGTIGSRFYMWYLAVTSANPLIGNGLGDFYTLTGDIAKYPHNIFVEFYFLFGIGGLFASILFFYKSLKYAIRTLSKVHIFRFVNSDIIIMFPILMFSSSVTGLLCNYITFVILQIMVLQKLKEYEYTDY